MIEATMGLAERLTARTEPLRQASLCLLVREGEVLLARKKRGFGVGKWNGVGGKPEPGETIDETAIRETEEEIGVTPLGLRRVATLDFLFPPEPEFAGWDQQVCVYVADRWLGEPVETEEVAPRWFAVAQVPLAEMWADDTYWLPLVLRGVRLRGHFLYNAEEEVVEYTIVEGEV
jgi:8-oxo-dGTP pyrophosphatase MutT (NUDIX family)